MPKCKCGEVELFSLGSVAREPDGVYHRRTGCGGRYHTYEVTLVEVDPHPQHRDGMVFKTRMQRRSRRDAARGFRDRFVVLDVQRVQ